MICNKYLSGTIKNEYTNFKTKFIKKAKFIL